MVGPKYHTPTTDAPAAYKELNPPADSKDADAWKVAQPSDAALRGKWWEIFNDPQLNALEEKVNVSNQNIAAAAASFFAARAMVKEARAQLFPTVRRLHRPSRRLARAQPVGQRSEALRALVADFLHGRAHLPTTALPFDATWQPDLFGRIRNTINAAAYGAQASAADLRKYAPLRCRPMWRRIIFNFADRTR